MLHDAFYNTTNAHDTKNKHMYIISRKKKTINIWLIFTGRYPVNMDMLSHKVSPNIFPPTLL